MSAPRLDRTAEVDVDVTLDTDAPEPVTTQRAAVLPPPDPHTKQTRPVPAQGLDDKNPIAPVGSPDFPYVITTYRLTEHHLSGVMSRQLPMLAELFHSHFVEISHELAAELGIQNGEKITVMSPRGKVHVTAMVTHRLKPFMIDGKKVHQIGVPWHWG